MMFGEAAEVGGEAQYLVAKNFTPAESFAPHMPAGDLRLNTISGRFVVADSSGFPIHVGQTRGMDFERLELAPDTDTSAKPFSEFVTEFLQ